MQPVSGQVTPPDAGPGWPGGRGWPPGTGPDEATSDALPMLDRRGAASSRGGPGPWIGVELAIGGLGSLRLTWSALQVVELHPTP
jgi:hypothetical protein